MTTVLKMWSAERGHQLYSKGRKSTIHMCGWMCENLFFQRIPLSIHANPFWHPLSASWLMIRVTLIWLTLGPGDTAYQWCHGKWHDITLGTPSWTSQHSEQIGSSPQGNQRCGPDPRAAGRSPWNFFSAPRSNGCVNMEGHCLLERRVRPRSVHSGG